MRRVRGRKGVRTIVFWISVTTSSVSSTFGATSCEAGSRPSRVASLMYSVAELDADDIACGGGWMWFEVNLASGRNRRAHLVTSAAPLPPVASSCLVLRVPVSQRIVDRFECET